MSFLVVLALGGLGAALALMLPPELFCTIPLHGSFVLDAELNLIWGEDAASEFGGGGMTRQGPVEVWDTHSGRLVRSHFGDVEPIQFAFSPKRRFLAVCDRQGNCHLADLKSGREYRALLTGTGDGPALLSFSLDESQLTVTQSGGSQVFDTAAGLLRKKITEAPKAVPAFRSEEREFDEGFPLGLGHWNPMANREQTIFSPDGKTRVTWRRKWNAKYGASVIFEFWDVPTGKKRAAGIGDQEDVGRCFFSPDCSLLAVVHLQYLRGIERGFDVWEVSTGRRLWGVKTTILKARRFTPDSRFLVGSDHTTASVPPLQFVDARTGEMRLWFPTDGRIQLTPDSRHLLVWERSEDRIKRNPHWFEEMLGRWWPSSPKIISKLAVFDLPNGREVAQLQDSTCSGARLSDGGTTLVMRRGNERDSVTLRLWHLPLRPPLRWIVGGPLALGMLLVLVWWWRTRSSSNKRPDAPMSALN